MYKRSAILYTFAYMATGAFTPLIGLYLDSIGLSGAQIGTVTAAGTCVAIAAVALWGRIYSGSVHKARDIELLCFGAIFAVAFLGRMYAFAAVITAYCLFFFFHSPILSLIDSFTASGAENSGFGSKRAWGAAGFAAGVFIAGRLSEAADSSVIFCIYGLSLAVAAITLGVIRRKDRPCVEDAAISKHKKGYRTLFRSRKVRRLLLCMFFMGGTNVANNTYFSFLYMEGGGTVAGVGTVMLLMVGSEVPFMFWSEKLAGRFTLEKTILAAMLISAARFIIYGTGLSWQLLTVLFFTQGAVNGIILVEFVRYIAKAAPPGCRSLAVSAYYVIGSNISTIVCQFIGGMILENAGAAGVYMFFGIFNLIGTVLYIMFGLHKAERSS